MKRVLSMILVLTLVLGITSMALAAEFVIRIAHTHTEDGQYYKGSVFFQELVEANSNGRVKVEHFPGGQLGADRDIQEGVQLGTIEAGLSSSPVVLLNDYFKLLDAPYLFQNREHVTAVLDGPIGRKLAQPLEAVGIKHLAYWENGFRQVTNNIRPIDIPADLAGIKLRTPESPVRMQTFRTLGANPVPMAFTELFGALQQRIVDGQENPMTTIYQASFQEVQKYLSITNHVYSPVHLLMNKRLFDSMPADLQEVVLEAAQAAAVFTRELCAENDGTLIAEFEAAGMEVNQANIPAFVEAVQPIWAEIAKDVRYDDAADIMSEIAAMGK